MTASLLSPRQRLALLLLGAFVILGATGSATLGESRDGVAGSGIVFRRGILDLQVNRPTSLAFGPDGRLYVASLNGTPPPSDHIPAPMKISAITLDPATHEVLGEETIATGLFGVLGLAFDPTAPPSPVVIYASHQDTTRTAGFQGEVSRFTGPSWQRQDVITGLPTSAPDNNHWTNGLAFDEQGTLFIAQGSATDSGITDPPGSESYWPETPLSAAILVADIHQPGFNGAITYSPSGPPADDDVVKTGGDVSVFASGTRNPYDLVVHSNGYIYATDNGPLGFGYSATCTTSGSPSSPSDELNLIEQGNYYGAPNRNRGLGIPDERQCRYRPSFAIPGPGDDFTPPIAILPNHCSCDGITEYTSDAFGGALQGDLVYTGLNGRVYRADLSGDGRSVDSISVLAMTFQLPLDVTVGPAGTLYIAEYGGNDIAFLAPDSDGDGCADDREGGPEVASGGQRDPNNPWDFYDVTGDGVIGLPDVLAVAQAFGPDTAPAYDAALDRSPAPPGGEPWAMGPPDGAINLFDDILGAARQFGASCLEP